MALKDGIYSAMLIASGGTFASPTGLAEVGLVEGAIDVPWALGNTKSNARITREGDIYMDGQGNYATAVDISVEDDPADTQLNLLKAALKAKTLVKVMFCPYLSAANTPPTDAAYIKGEYRVYGGSPSYSPGKPNGIKFELRRTKECNAAVLIEPV